MLPFAIRCPNCGRRLRVKNTRLLFAVYIVALAAVLALYFYANRRQLMTRSQRLIAGIASVVAVEFAASVFGARSGRFEKYDNEA